MDKRTVAKGYATEVLKKYKLISPSLDNLVYIVGDYGFEIIDFGRESNPGGVASLIAELSVQKYVEASNAFTFQHRDIKLIFVYEALSEEEKRYALAHELGHIACGHMRRNKCSSDGIEDEFEANEFAHYLLHPSPVRKILSYSFCQQLQLLYLFSCCSQELYWLFKQRSKRHIMALIMLQIQERSTMKKAA